MTSVFQSVVRSLLHPNISTGSVIPTRSTWKVPISKPRKRNPVWFVRKERTVHEDNITSENREFIQEVIRDQYGPPSLVKGFQSYANPIHERLVKNADFTPGEWQLGTRRCGLIARKIGVVPLWKKDGKKIMTTMLQVEDNHVIRYIPPDEYAPMQNPRVKSLGKFGCLMVGAGSTDPSLLTKEYANMFTENGIIPKKYLGRFLIRPSAYLPPGTPLNVTHFRIDDYVDVRGKTIDRGFQGVMKRWGFKGMPATHGVTKTHRRPGNIGAGGGKARVWPGTKMPGHMGNRYRINRGLRVWRMNTEYNVMWVSGLAIPGEVGSICYVYDTMLPLKRLTTAPPFPTCLTEPDPSVTEIWSDELHNFSDPTIFYEPEEEKK